MIVPQVKSTARIVKKIQYFKDFSLSSLFSDLFDDLTFHQKQYDADFYTDITDMEISLGSTNIEESKQPNQFSISPTDPLLELFNICPSYINHINHPIHDDDLARLWSEEFLVNTLIPQLQKEASELSKSNSDKTGAWARNVKCVHDFKLEDCPIFLCLICGHTTRGTRLFKYQSIKQHFLSQHQISKIDLDDVNIGVDFEEAIYYFWSPRYCG